MTGRNCKEQDAHLRLGFADDAMRGWFAAAGLELDQDRAA